MSFQIDPSTLIEWFKLSEEDVFNKFLDNKQSYYEYGHDHFKSILIPGERNDKVLLVSHVDTVWNDSPSIDPAYDNGIFFSKNVKRGVSDKGHPYLSGIGIGADDRAGCAALWHLRNLGHSILLVSGEEIGCLGSSLVASHKKLNAIVQDHQFIIELDRNGKSGLVFYDVGTEEFAEYCTKETNYSEANGSFSDICVLCEKICGVNLSIGYRNEHRPTELLFFSWWLNTLNVVSNWISKRDLPKFIR